VRDLDGIDGLDDVAPGGRESLKVSFQIIESYMVSDQVVGRFEILDIVSADFEREKQGRVDVDK
jgi:hypothetical protein